MGSQLLQTEASDWSLRNAGRPGRSYCRLGEPWGAAATNWSRAGPSSTMAGMSACTLWGRKAEAAIFSSCVAQPFLCQYEGLGGSRPQLWNVTGHTVLYGGGRGQSMKKPGGRGRACMHPGDPPCPGKTLISTLQLCRSLPPPPSCGHRPSCLPCRPLAFENSQNQLKGTQCCGAGVQGEALKYPEDYLLSPSMVTLLASCQPP